MSIDLSQFHQVFFEESLEGLDVMETALMDLDPQNVDDETINSIFRAAHSIKGGSATFGFTPVAEFTHVLETLLDQIRAGQRQVNNNHIELFLQSVDCMREMLALLQSGENADTPLGQELKKSFESILSSEDNEGDVRTAANSQANDSESDDKPGSWTITFKPEEDILKTGNEPVRMFRELSQLGSVEAQCDSSALPSLNSIDPEKCYLNWQLTVNSTAAREDILEIFEWVADDSEVILSANNISSQGSKHWLIHFIPAKDILRTGNDPVRMFAALSDLGKILNLDVDIAALPALSSLEPEDCYLGWKIHFESDASSEDIESIFEWVLDGSVVSISPVVLEEQSAANENITQGPKPVEDVTETMSSGNVSTSGTVAETTAVKSAAKPVASAKKAATGEASSIRVGIDKIDSLINMVGELVITQSMLGQLGSDFDLKKLPNLLEGLGQLEQNTRELQESVMRIRMLPISFTFSRFPRMVRDLSNRLNKKIQLETLGEQTELDKTVMEKIGDPLVHLVRNAVDHGIEEPEIRRAADKDETGTIVLNAYHQSGNVVIEIIDDGKGLDREAILQKAIDKNLMSETEAAALSDEQVYDLIFHPGFSTAKEVSDVSGRGVGMDVVKRNINALNGMVDIQSQRGKGSKITIRLPLTLAILDGQLVRVGNHTYIFPLVSIVESMQSKQELVSSVAGGCRVFKLRDDYVPIVELHKVFSITPDSEDIDKSLIVVVESDGEKVGIVVDDLLAQQQVVIKSLEQNYKRVNGVSGATILGDGTVALIVDIPGIVKIAGVNMAVESRESREQGMMENLMHYQERRENTNNLHLN